MTPTNTEEPRTRPKLDRSLEPVRLRRPSWWIWGGVGAFAMLAFLQLLITNERWQWDVVGSYLFSELVLTGLMRTIVLTLLALLGGLILGLVIAMMRLSENPVLKAFSVVYLWVVRAIPALVLLLFTYFLAALLPQLTLGIPFTDIQIFAVSTNDVISRFTAALICLILIEGAYIAEIIRGGILSVPVGQREAAQMLGMPESMIMRRVILPQSIRVMLPSLGNQFVTLFKNTSIVSFIGYAELLTTVRQVYQRTFETIPMLTVACIWYLVIASIAMYLQSRLEKRFSQGVRGADTGRNQKTARPVTAKEEM